MKRKPIESQIRELIDPVAGAAAQAKLAKGTNSIFINEPLRSWLLGLAQLKCEVGHVMAWVDIAARMSDAAMGVVAQADSGSSVQAMIGGAVRALDEDEINICRQYAANPIGYRSMQMFITKHEPKLHDSLNAVKSLRHPVIKGGGR